MRRKVVGVVYTGEPRHAKTGALRCSRLDRVIAVFDGGIGGGAPGYWFDITPTSATPDATRGSPDFLWLHAVFAE